MATGSCDSIRTVTHAIDWFTLTGSRTCPPGTFTCESNQNASRYACIPQVLVCDGVRNCLHGEDEQQSCAPRVCRQNEFMCANGICILDRWVCDHDNDCGDMSDEPSNCSMFLLH